MRTVEISVRHVVVARVDPQIGRHGVSLQLDVCTAQIYSAFEVTRHIRLFGTALGLVPEQRLEVPLAACGDEVGPQFCLVPVYFGYGCDVFALLRCLLVDLD